MRERRVWTGDLGLYAGEAQKAEAKEVFCMLATAVIKCSDFSEELV